MQYISSIAYRIWKCTHVCMCAREWIKTKVIVHFLARTYYSKKHSSAFIDTTLAALHIYNIHGHVQCTVHMDHRYSRLIISIDINTLNYPINYLISDIPIFEPYILLRSRMEPERECDGEKEWLETAKWDEVTIQLAQRWAYIRMCNVIDDADESATQKASITIAHCKLPSILFKCLQKNGKKICEHDISFATHWGQLTYTIFYFQLNIFQKKFNQILDR